MRVMVTATCSKLYDVNSIEDAEESFRDELKTKLKPDEIHQVDCSDDEEYKKIR